MGTARDIDQEWNEITNRKCELNHETWALHKPNQQRNLDFTTQKDSRKSWKMYQYMDSYQSTNMFHDGIINT